MKTLGIVTIVAVLACALSVPATAQVTEPIITATVADTNTMTLLIEGFNLPNGAVFMGQPGGRAKRLNVLSASSTAVEAQLLSAEPGTYIVAFVLSVDQYWTGYVTVGAVGPQGPQGPRGLPGLSGYRHVVLLNNFSVSSGSYAMVGTCNTGEKVISGGLYGGPSITVNGSYPASESTWTLAFTNTAPSHQSVSASIVCATVAP